MVDNGFDEPANAYAEDDSTDMSFESLIE